MKKKIVNLIIKLNIYLSDLEVTLTVNRSSSQKQTTRDRRVRCSAGLSGFNFHTAEAKNSWCRSRPLLYQSTTIEHNARYLFSVFIFRRST